MYKNYNGWNNTLKELNNFNSKIEFLQSKMRDIVVERKSLDVADYMQELNKFIEEHEYNLYSILDKKNMDVFITRNLIMNRNLEANINQKNEIVL